MDRKKILRNPLLWVIAGLVLYYAFGFLLDDTRGYSQVTTSQALQQLTDHNSPCSLEASFDGLRALGCQGVGVSRRTLICWSW